MRTYTQIKYLNELVELIKEKDSNAELRVDDDNGLCVLNFMHKINDVNILVEFLLAYISPDYMDQNRISFGIKAELPFMVDESDKAYELIEDIKAEREYDISIYIEDSFVKLRYMGFSVAEMNIKFYESVLFHYIWCLEFVYQKLLEKADC